MSMYDVQVKDGCINIESASELLQHMGLDRPVAAFTVMPDSVIDDDDFGTNVLFLDIDAIDRLVAVLAQVRKDLVNIGASS